MKYGTATDTLTDTITTLPVDLYADGNNATVGLKGNMVQSGTPTPQNPIRPSECGERTAQLIPEIVQGGVSTTDGSFSQSSNRVRTKYIPVESGKTYAISSGNQYLATGCYYNNGVFSSKINEVEAVTTSATFTVPENVNQIAIGFRTAIGTINIAPSDLQNYMLNEGLAPLPYEPYGYKIPISSANTTTPVYLGEVQSTRKIKKLVLTEEEDIAYPGANVFRFNVTNYLRELTNKPYCTHYVGITPVSSVDGLGDKRVAFLISATGNNYMYIRDNAYSSITAFKQFLSDQYATGTPVTVWYVLAEPETTILNEPIRKIGEYADSVSVTNIPTTSGSQTFDVDTTLKPSEADLTYHGWHRIEPKKIEVNT